MSIIHSIKAKVKSEKDTKKDIVIPDLFKNLIFDSIDPKPIKISIQPKKIGDWELDKKTRCMICWGNIKSDEKLEHCPHCNNAFHHFHWTEWIAKKGECPVCRQKVR